MRGGFESGRAETEKCHSYTVKKQLDMAILQIVTQKYSHFLHASALIMEGLLLGRRGRTD